MSAALVIQTTLIILVVLGTPDINYISYMNYTDFRYTRYIILIASQKQPIHYQQA